VSTESKYKNNEQPEVANQDASIENHAKLYKSKSDEDLEPSSKENNRKINGRKKSGNNKSINHKPNKSVIEHVDDEEMEKILNELKYFKDHINASKNNYKMKQSK